MECWDGGGLRLTPAVVEGIYGELHRRNGVPVSHWDIVELGARFNGWYWSCTTPTTRWCRTPMRRPSPPG